MNRKKFLSDISYAGIGLSTLGIGACNKKIKKEKISLKTKNPFFKLSLYL